MKSENRIKVSQVLKELTLFDDDLMGVCFDNNIPATELLLNILLEQNDIHVLSVRGQVELKNPRLGGRKIRLDILAEDHYKQRFNVEVQRSTQGGDPKRARFHSSMIDSRMLDSGQSFGEMKDSYIIFITENDFFKKGYPLYHIERRLSETGEKFGDGSHIIYVNGTYRGEDAIGKLMEDFHCENPSDMNYLELAESVRYYKEEGGNKGMSEIVERFAREYAKEYAAETLIRVSKEYGASEEKILSDLQEKVSLSLEDAKRVYEMYQES